MRGMAMIPQLGHFLVRLFMIRSTCPDQNSLQRASDLMPSGVEANARPMSSAAGTMGRTGSFRGTQRVSESPAMTSSRTTILATEAPEEERT
jgi:hypothetical protein